MSKATMKVWLTGSKKPLFAVDIYDDIEKTIDEFIEQVSARENYLVRFGSIAFRRDLFHHIEIEYSK